MAPDRLIPLVVDGSGLKHAVDLPEDLLHLSELFVLECYLGRVQIGVGPQHPFTIESRIGLYLVPIHCDIVPVKFQILSVSFVANQPFGVFFNLLF